MISRYDSLHVTQYRVRHVGVTKQNPTELRNLSYQISLTEFIKNYLFVFLVVSIYLQDEISKNVRFGF